jgi:hypothetical protein
VYVIQSVCVCVSRASSLKRRCRPYEGTLTSPKGGGGIRTDRSAALVPGWTRHPSVTLKNPDRA